MSRRPDRPVPLPTTDVLRQAFDQLLQLDRSEGNASADTVVTYQRRINQYSRWCEDQGVAPAIANADDSAHSAAIGLVRKSIVLAAGSALSVGGEMMCDVLEFSSC